MLVRVGATVGVVHKQARTGSLPSQVGKEWEVDVGPREDASDDAQFAKGRDPLENLIQSRRDNGVLEIQGPQVRE